ncbi:MAG: hypothetical protein H5T64_11105 [Chloroflexi bacterium]|nr:hypothetical protein [Chloroflexota bacterium]
MAAMNPALAERMPGFRNETLPDQGLWRQIVVEWLGRIQEDHPHAFRYWLDRCLEGAKTDSRIVGTVIHLPTPERPTAEAPELSEWGLKWDAGRKAYVTLDNRYGLPAGSEAGIYAKEKYFVNGEERWGWIGLKPKVIAKLQEDARQRGEFKIPLMFDPRGMVVQIEEEQSPYGDPTLKFIGLKGLNSGTVFRSPVVGTVFFIREAFVPDKTKFNMAVVADSTGEILYCFFLPNNMEVLIPDLTYGEKKGVFIGEAIFKLKNEKIITNWFPGEIQVAIPSEDGKNILDFNADDILNQRGDLVFTLP